MEKTKKELVNWLLNETHNLEQLAYLAREDVRTPKYREDYYLARTAVCRAEILFLTEGEEGFGDVFESICDGNGLTQGFYDQISIIREKKEKMTDKANK